MREHAQCVRGFFFVNKCVGIGLVHPFLARLEGSPVCRPTRLRHHLRRSHGFVDCTNDRRSSGDSQEDAQRNVVGVARDVLGVHIHAHGVDRHRWCCLNGDVLCVREYRSLAPDNTQGSEDLEMLAFRILGSSAHGCMRFATYDMSRRFLSHRNGHLSLRVPPQELEPAGPNEFDFKRHTDTEAEDGAWHIEAATQKGSFVASDNDGYLRLAAPADPGFLQDKAEFLRNCASWIVAEQDAVCPG